MALPILLALGGALITICSFFRRDVTDCSSLDDCGFNVQEEITSEFMLNFTCSNLPKYHSCYDAKKGDCKDINIETGLASVDHICRNSATKSDYMTLVDCVRAKKDIIDAKKQLCTVQEGTCEKMQEYINCMSEPVDDCCGHAVCTTSFNIIKASLQPALDNTNLGCDLQLPNVCIRSSRGTCA